MFIQRHSHPIVLSYFGLMVAFIFLVSGESFAQGTRADYERSANLQKLTQKKVFRDRVRPVWFDEGTKFWYRVTTGVNQREFLLVDAVKGTRQPAFDHARMAEAILKAGVKNASPEQLPIQDLVFTLAEDRVDLFVQGKWWRCNLKNYEFKELSAEERPKKSPSKKSPEELRFSRETGPATEITFVNHTPNEVEIFWIDPSGQAISYGKIAAGKEHSLSTFSGHVWRIVGERNRVLDVLMAEETPLHVEIAPQTPSDAPSPPRKKEPSRPHGSSPDGKWIASIKEHNVWIRDASSNEEFPLSRDGLAEDAYSGEFFWSPDSKRLVALRTKRGEHRQVTFVESSPPDQIQPRVHSFTYTKPGDRIDQSKPHLFDLDAKKPIELGDALYSNPWSITQFRWSSDSSRFSFLYNQRGHQVMRVVSIDAENGEARSIVEEQCDTFFCYSHKQFLHEMEASRELIWMSERDGWNHLYLYDTETGKVKNQITQGNWVVRGVDRVDAERRQIWFRAGGIRPEQDPYFIHYCRINFDGTGLVVLTEGDGTHRIEYSPDGRYFLDTYSRVDLPPVTELRRTEDGKRVCEVERADWSALLAAGWQPPVRFTAKGRDGSTDIYGILWRPTNFDPKKKYPIIEDIYAGPHDSFVPKDFHSYYYDQSLAELGFILVKIDGMGTSNRSKKFHDVCFKNIGDAGLPDRIAWMRAAAEKYPSMDLSRVGIFGGSAGGQSAAGAVMTHGDFYKVAVADCGCHDNRMDKIWWNEQWMGWPIGPEYAASSNVTKAAQLKGKLMLIVGEMDTNVDPASTMQVANALIKADKDFDLLVIPGANHGAAESPYGKRRRADYFVRHLLGVEPRENSR